MALNTSKRNLLTPLRFIGLSCIRQSVVASLNW